MKPFTFGSKNMCNYTDVHPKKGWINWWEDRNFMKSKKAKRQKDKKELKYIIENR